MPVLYHYKKREGAYVKASIEGALITFQLTAEGEEQLAAAGFAEPKSRFSQHLLNDLIRSRDAFTGADQPAVEEDDEALGQYTFGYDDDVREAALVPRCAESRVIEDLHLVVYRVAAGRREQVSLLGASVRRAMTEAIITLSVPFGLIDRRALQQLIAIGKVPEKDRAVLRLQQWFAVERSREWAEIRRTHAEPVQGVLDMEDEGVLL